MTFVLDKINLKFKIKNMKTFFVLYDLDKSKTREYKSLNISLKEAFDYVNNEQGSVWLVKLNDNNSTIKDVKKKLNDVFLSVDDVIIIEPKEYCKL